MINLSLSLAKSLAYTIIWVLFVSPSCVLSVDERHKHCTPWFECAYQTLFYPFWKPDREVCGHPDFKVDCSGDFPEFNISSVKFQILEMNHYDRIIRLARMDYRHNLCPQDPENAIINQKILPFVQDTELRTFYYNCSGPTVGVLPNGYIKELECDEEIGVQSYFVSLPSHPGNKAVLDELSASCERNVTIPVSRSAMKTTERNQTLEAIKKALDDGFKLSFNSECAQCLASIGACGRNESSTAFVCYCIDEPHEYTCPSEIVQKSNDLSFSVSLNILADQSYSESKFVSESDLLISFHKNQISPLPQKPLEFNLCSSYGPKVVSSLN